MSDVERDELTGTETTGHEWDGIKELNTPLPKWWLYVFYATIVWSVGYFIAFPAWPSLSGYTSGVLGYSSRAELNETMDELRASRAGWYDRFEQVSVAEAKEDTELLQFAMAGGDIIFADNCAGCHGTGGIGAKGGYPALVDDAWIWGGTIDEIHATIQYGIRNEHEDSRFSEMPAFGVDGILSREEVAAVTDYVLSLSGAGEADSQGATIFEEQCVACHDEDGKGIAELGAPNLTDGIWLYGGSRNEIISQIHRPKHGVMPPWVGRLNPVEIKQLAIYVHSLGGGQETVDAD